MALVAILFIAFVALMLSASLRHNAAFGSLHLPEPKLAQREFHPPILKSLIVNPESRNNYFSFILDTGERASSDKAQLEPEVRDLIHHFFLGVTLPSEDFWVNLNFSQEDRITSPRLGLTDAGKILLEADLKLKKDVAYLTDPRHATGAEYWRILNEEIQKLRLVNPRIPQANRVWIVPDEVMVEEENDTFTITRARLKVCLESDYLAKYENNYIYQNEEEKRLIDCARKAMEGAVLPFLEREVNYGIAYAPLRQVYHSLILAECYKRRYWGKKGFFPSTVNQGYLEGLHSKTPWSKKGYFDAYVRSVSQGEYSFRRTEFDPYQFDMIKKQYVSGGIKLFFTKGLNIEPVKLSPQKSHSSPIVSDNNGLLQAVAVFNDCNPEDIWKSTIGLAKLTQSEDPTSIVSSPALGRLEERLAKRLEKIQPPDPQLSAEVRSFLESQAVFNPSKLIAQKFDEGCQVIIMGESRHLSPVQHGYIAQLILQLAAKEQITHVLLERRKWTQEAIEHYLDTGEILDSLRDDVNREIYRNPSYYAILEAIRQVRLQEYDIQVIAFDVRNEETAGSTEVEKEMADYILEKIDFNSGVVKALIHTGGGHAWLNDKEGKLLLAGWLDKYLPGKVSRILCLEQNGLVRYRTIDRLFGPLGPQELDKAIEGSHFESQPFIIDNLKESPLSQVRFTMDRPLSLENSLGVYDGLIYISWPMGFDLTKSPFAPESPYLGAEGVLDWTIPSIKADSLPIEGQDSDRGGVDFNRISSIYSPAKKVILVVDDNGKERKKFVDALQKEGYHTLTAGGMQEALAILEEKRVDAILTDMIMSNGTGLELAEAAKGLNPELLIIIHSGETVDNLQNIITRRSLDVTYCNKGDFPKTVELIKKKLEESNVSSPSMQDRSVKLKRFKEDFKREIDDLLNSVRANSKVYPFLKEIVGKIDEIYEEDTKDILDMALEKVLQPFNIGYPPDLQRHDWEQFLTLKTLQADNDYGPIQLITMVKRNAEVNIENLVDCLEEGWGKDKTKKATTLAQDTFEQAYLLRKVLGIIENEPLSSPARANAKKTRELEVEAWRLVESFKENLRLLIIKLEDLEEAYRDNEWKAQVERINKEISEIYSQLNTAMAKLINIIKSMEDPGTKKTFMEKLKAIKVDVNIVKQQLTEDEKISFVEEAFYKALDGYLSSGDFVGAKSSPVQDTGVAGIDLRRMEIKAK